MKTYKEYTNDVNFSKIEKETNKEIAIIKKRNDSLANDDFESLDFFLSFVKRKDLKSIIGRVTKGDTEIRETIYSILVKALGKPKVDELVKKYK